MNACDTASFVTVSPGEEKYGPTHPTTIFHPSSQFQNRIKQNSDEKYGTAKPTFLHLTCL